MTKAQVKARKDAPKLKVRKGDRVMIIAGKDKGEIGFIHQVLTKRDRVVVLQENDENPDQPLPLNVAVRHRKARMQGEKSAKVQIAAPIHISNVMVLDPKTGQPSRLGRRKEGDKTVRYAKKSGEALQEIPFEKAEK